MSSIKRHNNDLSYCYAFNNPVLLSIIIVHILSKRIICLVKWAILLFKQSKYDFVVYYQEYLLVILSKFHAIKICTLVKYTCVRH